MMPRCKRETGCDYYQVNCGLTDSEHADLMRMATLMGCSQSRAMAQALREFVSRCDLEHRADHAGEITEMIGVS